MYLFNGLFILKYTCSIVYNGQLYKEISRNSVAKLLKHSIIQLCLLLNAICQSVAEVYLTGVVPLGTVSHRFNF
jgi:hypothetical protein